MMPSLVLLVFAAAAPAPAAPVAPSSATTSPDPRAITATAARQLLFAALPVSTNVCDGLAEQGTTIRCLLGQRYQQDQKAKQLALELYERTGSLAGLLEEQDFDGGYRGPLHLVPHLPVLEDRVHLERVTAAMTQVDTFLHGLTQESGVPPRYRMRAIAFEFFRSVNRRTPAAFAGGWRVAYNVRGTLNHSVPAVRSLLFHEIFHLNDQAAGDWSKSNLGPIHAKIVARCDSDPDCLSAYVWGWLKARNRTYYAFMPGNGVEEYAAELANNYLSEQLAMLAGRRVPLPFKCGPPENAEAWQLIVEHFFAGVDRVPPCRAK